MSDVTRILTAIERGDAKASDELLPIVYEELRHMAARKMASERAGHTLQPTALVHEAWLSLTLNVLASRGSKPQCHYPPIASPGGS